MCASSAHIIAQTGTARALVFKLSAHDDRTASADSRRNCASGARAELQPRRGGEEGQQQEHAIEHDADTPFLFLSSLRGDATSRREVKVCVTVKKLRDRVLGFLKGDPCKTRSHHSPAKKHVLAVSRACKGLSACSLAVARSPDRGAGEARGATVVCSHRQVLSQPCNHRTTFYTKTIH